MEKHEVSINNPSIIGDFRDAMHTIVKKGNW